MAFLIIIAQILQKIYTKFAQIIHKNYTKLKKNCTHFTHKLQSKGQTKYAQVVFHVNWYHEQNINKRQKTDHILFLKKEQDLVGLFDDVGNRKEGMKMHLTMGGKGGNMVELIFHESAFDHLFTEGMKPRRAKT